MEPRALNIVHAFLWSFGVVTVLAAGFGVLAASGSQLVAHPAFAGGWIAAVYGAGTLAVLRFHPHPGGIRAALGARAANPRLPPIVGFLGALSVIPIATLERLNEMVAPTPAAVAAERAALLGTGMHARTMLAVLFLGCVAPLCQEFFFRGVLYAGLARTSSARGAALVTGVCFVIVNPELRAWLPLGALATLLSFLRLRSGTIISSVCLHVGYATTWVYLGSLGLVGSGRAEGFSVPWVLCGWFGVGALSYWVHRIANECRACELARAEDES